MMKLSFLAAVVLASISSITVVEAFTVTSSPQTSSSRSVVRTSSSVSLSMTATREQKEDLLLTCRRLKEDNGVFLVDKDGKAQLEAAVADLEKLAIPPPSESSSSSFASDMQGEWTLLCTTSTSGPSLDKSKLPGFLTSGPLEELRRRVQANTNRDIKVVQSIQLDKKKNDGTTNAIDRIDHVIEYTPPKFLQDVLDNLPDQLTSFDINPLEVSKSKLILVHNAQVIVDNNDNNNKIKLSLKSVVLNVAGTSTSLDPNGADLIGINIPALGDFLKAGDFVFETTYLDDTLRISRSKKQGLAAEQLRVFVRTGSTVTVPVVVTVQEDKLDETTNVKDDGMDVDASIDPEFTADEDDGDANDANSKDDDDEQDESSANGDDSSSDAEESNEHDPSQDDVSPSDY